MYENKIYILSFCNINHFPSKYIYLSSTYSPCHYRFGCKGMFGWRALTLPTTATVVNGNQNNNNASVAHGNYPDDDDHHFHFAMGNGPPPDFVEPEPVFVNHKELVLTSNELDAVIISHTTGKQALALPCSDNNLSQEVSTTLYSVV